jgi:hypothetical protein
MGKEKRYKQSDINPKGGNTGDVIKTTETNTQLEIPNLYKGIKKAKAKDIDAFRPGTTESGQVNDNIA